MRRPDALRLVGFLAVCLLVQLAAGLATAPSIPTWYADLRKPDWTPPGAVFGPVWTALYLAIAIAGWLVHRAPAGRGRSAALALWWIQLGLNLAWSFAFFFFHSPGAGLLDIALLWCAIAAFLATAYRVRRAAALLLLPYLAWVSFATALNAAIWRLNP